MSVFSTKSRFGQVITAELYEGWGKDSGRNALGLGQHKGVLLDYPEAKAFSDAIAEIVESIRPKTKTQYRHTYTSPWSDRIPNLGAFDSSCVIETREVRA